MPDTIISALYSLSHLIITTILKGSYYPHFTAKKTKTQKGSVIRPRLSASKWLSPSSNTCNLTSEPEVLTSLLCCTKKVSIHNITSVGQGIIKSVGLDPLDKTACHSGIYYGLDWQASPEYENGAGMKMGWGKEQAQGFNSPWPRFDDGSPNMYAWLCVGDGRITQIHALFLAMRRAQVTVLAILENSCGLQFTF